MGGTLKKWCARSAVTACVGLSTPKSVCTIGCHRPCWFVPSSTHPRPELAPVMTAILPSSRGTDASDAQEPRAADAPPPITDNVGKEDLQESRDQENRSVRPAVVKAQQRKLWAVGGRLATGGW